MEIINVLLVEDEEYDVRRIENTLHPFSDRICIRNILSTGEDTLAALNQEPEKYDVIILDYQISGSLHGKELVLKIKAIDDTLQVIIITKMTLNQTDLSLANEMLESGAFWFGTKNPSDIEDFIYHPTDFILAITNAVEKRKLEQANKRILRKNEASNRLLQNNIHFLMKKWSILGNSEETKLLLDIIQRYASAEANLLITGESGTGKELVARNIHYLSERRYENFITVNCSAIPTELMESELFGYEKGSFTDARHEKIGLFEQAHMGTLFLDEVGDLPLGLQAKLLRVLETGEIDKIGRKKSYSVNVRVLSATNKDLQQMITEKQFREDLFYRLNILNINISPLRKRKTDILFLLGHYMEKYSGEFHTNIPLINEEGRQCLIEYSWPGNVRHLKNFVQRILLMNLKEAGRDSIRQCIEIWDHDQRPDLFTKAPQIVKPLWQAEFEFRKNYCEYVRTNSKNDAEAAVKLGMARSNFHRLLKELGLK